MKCARLAPLVLLMMTGCADATSSRFASGAKAITHNDDVNANTHVRYDLVFLHMDGFVFGETHDVVGVNVGTLVRIVADDEPKGSEYRKVRVRITEGKNEDKVGFIYRKYLRPAP